MKAGFFILAAIAIAQPHGRRHRHHNRALLIETNVVTVANVVTAIAPVKTAVVYVDGDGNTLSTGPHIPNGNNAATAKPPADSGPAPTQPAAGNAPEPSVPASSSETKTASAPAASSPVLSDAAGYGLAYSPYNGDGTCKTQAQINSDFDNIDGYGLIRLYGTDCDQTAMVMKAAKSKGLKIFAGVYDITQVNSEIQLIIEAAQNNWDMIDTVGVGNEGVNDGRYSVPQAVSAVNAARGLLKGAGYRGKVVTVDTFVAIINNPQLCQASDYAAANCHAFFDGGQTAAQAGQFTLTQAHRVSQACGGKETVITEAGWPWRGSTNGAAIPSVANQATAIASLKSSLSTNNLILFTAFDDMWKKNNAQTFNAEQFWGMLNHAT